MVPGRGARPARRVAHDRLPQPRPQREPQALPQQPVRELDAVRLRARAGIAAALPVVVLAIRGASGLDVYGWLGSLATYGFIVTYALICIALPRYLRMHKALHAEAKIVSALACIAMLLALVGNLYPVPEGPYGKLPYIYLCYLAAGLLWFLVSSRNKNMALIEG